MTLRAKNRKLGDHEILEFFGDIDLRNLEEASEILWKAIIDSKGSLIIDLGSVDYMDSSGIGMLVSGNRNMQDKQGQFALLSVPQDLMKLLRLADLDCYFTIYEKEEDIPV